VSKIFVFGSNLAGRHGKGAALTARNEYGAQYGVGEGRTGNAYAIPTKGHQLEVLSLSQIELSVQRFLAYASKTPCEQFFVTRIGCGLAGYTDAQISPFFAGASSNVELPAGWANTKGADMPSLVVHKMHAPYDVYIGRGHDSIFGNPFTHKENTAAKIVVGSREEAVQAFRDWLAGTAYQEVEPERRQAILDAIPTLKGKVLGCWCAPLACHGDVLAELANGDAPLPALPKPIVESEKPRVAKPKVPVVEPGNIFSGERSARTVLTNPTELARRKGNLRHSYPVEIDGVVFPDAEEAYQTLKFYVENSDEAREDLCVLIITAKLRQHPMLVEFILRNGGVRWLIQCRHQVSARSAAFSYWEGDGLESAFIRCMIKAYKLVRATTL
jgi:hypothetical protein